MLPSSIAADRTIPSAKDWLGVLGCRSNDPECQRRDREGLGCRSRPSSVYRVRRVYVVSGHHRFSGPDRADRLGYRERPGHPAPRLVACGAPFFSPAARRFPGSAWVMTTSRAMTSRAMTTNTTTTK
eukprot:scaffold30197_cov67-Phaeocystis_antarctica.AAC.4